MTIVDAMSDFDSDSYRFDAAGRQVDRSRFTRI
jgi:hypothetical protein